jgi:hypothetical protein
LPEIATRLGGLAPGGVVRLKLFCFENRTAIGGPLNGCNVRAMLVGTKSQGTGYQDRMQGQEAFVRPGIVRTQKFSEMMGKQG